MSRSSTESSSHTRLRDEAESRLKAGTTESVGRHSLGLEALSLLHRLSSNPDTAGDAMKLLHELQVHQVEIDLQIEGIRNDELLIAEELAHYRELYECAPVGYLLVGFKGEIIKANQAAADLMDVEPTNLKGALIQNFMSSDSRPALLGLLSELEECDQGQCPVISANCESTQSRPLQMMARLAPESRCVLLVCHQAP